MLERDLATWPNHELSEFVEAGGLRWHVQRAGSGPNLLLIHGTAASVHSWRDLIPALAEKYSVLALDLPGHGFTGQIPTAQSTIAGISNLVTELLRKLSFDPSFVVGHSAGAVILCNMAIGNQVNPRVVISVNGAFLPLVGTASALFGPLAKLLATTPFLPRLLARRASHRDNVARVLEATGSHLDAVGIDLYVRLARQPAHIRGVLRMMSQWDLESFHTQLSMLRQPLALLVASKDKAVPLHQAIEVMQHVADATMFPLQDLGHLAHEERPELVTERILKICATYQPQ